MANPEQKTENVAAVLKVFSVLESLVENRKSTLADLANLAMTSKATTHRLLNTMIELGYVEKDEDTERYGLTLKLFSLGARSIKDRSDLLWAADRVMAKLSRLTGESINLGIMDNTEEKVVYTHKYDSHYNLSMQSTLGKRNPLHSTSLGKALLAWRDPKEIEDRMSRMTFEVSAPNTITDRETLFNDLIATKERGYAEEIEESEAGVRCIAVPIFDHLGRPVAAMSIAFPLFRFSDERKPEIIKTIIKLGQEASTSLGYVPHSVLKP
ncbi:IclR family KDG regulon transcriptional repressor [Yoonia maritima]|uniref:IclR family KDG regulon transcriptional repressor n=1 Tax=Yoonia maritima TaxID=1435347 RepID=A0A2T0W567_9RHOB|nr:IclR family transcriptional regulator C-terminal domain-containing protein [Yoonia maritima]PRY80618.1 IclR family KDG regulon transcriptional repressor [Yoonia maritima]